MNSGLSPKQNLVINWLQKGGGLITSSESKKVWVYKGQDRIGTEISATIFWNLVAKGLIAQRMQYPFWYELTNTGKAIKAKDV